MSVLYFVLLAWSIARLTNSITNNSKYGRPKLGCGRPKVHKQSAVARDLWIYVDRLLVLAVVERVRMSALCRSSLRAIGVTEESDECDTQLALLTANITLSIITVLLVVISAWLAMRDSEKLQEVRFLSRSSLMYLICSLISLAFILFVLRFLSHFSRVASIPCTDWPSRVLHASVHVCFLQTPSVSSIRRRCCAYPSIQHSSIHLYSIKLRSGQIRPP